MSKWMSVAAVVVLLGAAAGAARAQAEWDAFIVGGYTNGSLEGGSEKLLGNKNQQGFYSGVTLQLLMEDTYGFAVGVRYTRKGGGGTIDSTFAVSHYKNVTRAIGDGDITLDFVEIPLVVIIFADLNERSYFSGYAGPCIDILARAKLVGTDNGRAIDQDIKSTMQSIQLSGTIGAGYTYKFKSWDLMLDVHIWQGITKVVDGSNITTRDFSGGLGIGIPLAQR
jgi:opacity protein-like surface antigen